MIFLYSLLLLRAGPNRRARTPRADVARPNLEAQPRCRLVTDCVAAWSRSEGRTLSVYSSPGRTGAPDGGLSEV